MPDQIAQTVGSLRIVGGRLIFVRVANEADLAAITVNGSTVCLNTEEISQLVDLLAEAGCRLERRK